MKKALTLIALCSLALMASEETKELKYTGQVLMEKCKDGCTYNDYKVGDKLQARIEGKTYNIIMNNRPPMSEAKMEMAYGRDDVTFVGTIKGNTIVASQVERIPTYEGFLGVQSCTQNGVFADCDLKKYSDGDTVVAVIGGKTYQLDKQTISNLKIHNAIMQNNVGFFGQINGDTLKLENMIYEGGKKEFFKGCV